MKTAIFQDIGDLFRKGYYKAIPYKIRNHFGAKHRNQAFQEAMAQFLSDPNACANPNNNVLSALVFGWGNEAWSAREEFLASCIIHSLTTKGAILECGSGLSSVLIAAIAKNQGISHWVLEHKSEWAQTIQTYLDQYKLPSPIDSRPLKDYGDYHWYDAPFDVMPDKFSLIVCDGPPRRTKGGRYGLIPVMKERIKSGCVILLDDGYRQEELDIAKRWAAELKATFTVQGTTKPYIVMTLP